MFLTISSLLLSISVYFIAKGIYISDLGYPLFNNLNFIPSSIVYFVIVIVFTKISLLISNKIDSEQFDEGSFQSVEIANDAFLPSYLGYFFVSLSAASLSNTSNETFIFVFCIISVFIFCSRISYFNPVFLLLGYNFFYMVTNNNLKVIVITKSKVKKPSNFCSDKMKRINDYTFIDMEL